MDGEWIFSEQVTADSSAMEESLIEMFGCVDMLGKVIRIYISNDKKQVRRDVCIGDEVVDSQITPFPGFLNNPLTPKGSAAGATRLVA